MTGVMVQESKRDHAFEAIDPLCCENGRALRSYGINIPLLKVRLIPRREDAAVTGRRHPRIGEGDLCCSAVLIELRTQAGHAKLQGKPVDSRLREEVVSKAAEQ